MWPQMGFIITDCPPQENNSKLKCTVYFFNSDPVPEDQSIKLKPLPVAVKCSTWIHISTVSLHYHDFLELVLFLKVLRLLDFSFWMAKYLSFEYCFIFLSASTSSRILCLRSLLVSREDFESAKPPTTVPTCNTFPVRSGFL